MARPIAVVLAALWSAVDGLVVNETELKATTSCRVLPGTQHDEVVCFPRVLLLGARRTGTTALFDFLIKHKLIVPPGGPKENTRICKLTAQTSRDYEGHVGRNLAERLESRGNPSLEPLLTLEASPTNTVCPGPQGLKHRMRFIAQTFRPRAIFLHRDPIDRAWSEFKFFATFKVKECAPSPQSFVDLVRAQTSTLLRCEPFFKQWLNGVRTGHGGCLKELEDQLQDAQPFMPCGHLARVVPGFSHYFEKRWRAELGDKHVLSVTHTELLKTRMGPRLWEFLNITYTHEKKTPDLNGRLERKTPRPHPEGAAFLADLGDAEPPAEAVALLRSFYETFDPHSLTALI